MNTTQKTGINVFPISVDFFDKPEICAVTIEHGIKGQAATMMLLCAIYRNGYFIEWKPENFLPILKELPGIKIKKIEKIVKTLVEWGFFDRTLFEQHQVLSNREIQKHYLDAAKFEIQRAEDTLPYWLTDENDNEDTNDPEPDDDIANEENSDDIADEDTGEHRVLDIAVDGPLHDIRLTCLYGALCLAEVHRQRTTSESGRCEGLHRGTLQRRASEVVYTEWQAQRVPRAVSVERASLKRHTGYVVVGITDGSAVVTIVSLGDGSWNYIVCAVREDAVLVYLHRAVVLH